MSIIVLERYVKEYRDFRLGPVDLTLEPGILYGLVGPNGAGKTTLLKALLGLTYPTSGSVRVFGLDPRKDERAVKVRIGFTLETGGLWAGQKLKTLDGLYTALYPDWDSAGFRGLCDAFGLPEKKPVKTFTPGMRSQLALALALGHKADLLLLDEPTSGLDPAARKKTKDLVRDYLGTEGRTAVYSTHITSDLEGIADHLIFLVDGQVVYTGPYDRFLDRHRLVKAAPDRLTDDEQARLTGLRTTPTVVSGLTDDPGFWAGRPGVLAEPTDLEEIFVRYTKGRAGR